jgi:hypothetical protein
MNAHIEPLGSAAWRTFELISARAEMSKRMASPPARCCAEKPWEKLWENGDFTSPSWWISWQKNILVGG